MAIEDMVDKKKKERKAGEKWLVREVGGYLPDVSEKVMETVKAEILTDKVAIRLRAKRHFEDVYGGKRKAGEEWLVTN